jgi:hypothetical protein
VPWTARGSLYSCGKAVRPAGVDAELVLALMAVGAIRDGESTRRDGGAVGQDPTGSDAMESEPGQRQARGGRRLAAAMYWWPAMACLRGLARGTRDGAGDEVAAWSGMHGLAR